MTTKVKICGLRRAGDIAAANELKPDYVGFVFAAGRVRRVSPEEALALKRLLDPAIRAVGVFVDEPVEEIAAIRRSGAIDMVQLHGGEDDERRMAALRTEAPGTPVIRAFKVRTAADLAAAEASAADWVLLDAGAGEGRAFDWALLAERPIGRPYFLAGGLGPENVAEAVRLLQPFAVDASSSLETDGFKDFGKMAKFISEIRR